MSIAKHHAEWLKLIEVSGPFLSLSVLQKAFPQGLEAHDPDLAAQLRSVYAEWEIEVGCARPDMAIHRAWVRWVLTTVLEYPADLLAEGQTMPPGLEARLPQEGETLTPDLALVDPDQRSPVLLFQLLRPGQGLEQPLPDRRWKASPVSRMVELLHGTGVPLGLVTNGEQWMLVHAPRGETSGFASWYADLWREEQLSLRAFRSLLGVRRFFGVAEGDRLKALLEASAADQQDVTDQLGYQVRKAVEVLVQKVDRINKDQTGSLLEHVTEAELYEAVLSVMMRLVFLFSAEERGLLLLGDPLWDAHYSVSTLGPQLREDADRHGEEVLERRTDAWARLLATFRAVHGGIDHSLLRLPAYGGALFDPDRFPFLEGRGPGTRWQSVDAEPLAIDNRTVLHLLEALQYLQMAVPGAGVERRKLSFRALDIEQIGHVYEGLLDHTAKRTSEPMLGLVGAKRLEPELPLGTLEATRAQGEAKLLALLKEATKRSESALRRALAGDLELDLHRLRAACDNDEALLDRVIPFAGLLASDTHGDPLVITTGSIFVTQGSDRRSTGTHYTPRSLTEPIVRHTLDPLVYHGMADGVTPSPETLIGPDGILKLKVVDFACGSGAFLVQACRYLAEKLVEAWEREEARSPSKPLAIPEAAHPTGAAEERLLPKATEERLAIARRLVADRCLYGVDRNPMAVEMAKLSLWLVTLQKNRPFEFLDHAMKCGDSLLGVVSVEQLKAFHLVASRGRETVSKNPLFAGLAHRLIDAALAEAAKKRIELENFAVNDIRDAETKARLHGEAELALDRVRLIGDLVTGATLKHAGRDRALDGDLEQLMGKLLGAFDPDQPDGARSNALNSLRGAADALFNGGKPLTESKRRCLHWPIEFPELFEGTNSGFDAIIGNPPFQGGTMISGEHGASYQNFLKNYLASVKSGGRADLCAYFFLRAQQLLRHTGGFGLLATNTIAEGDTREVGLQAMVASNIVIHRAISSQKWPGVANLEVAQVWARKGGWNGSYVLDEQQMQGITPYLKPQSTSPSDPYRLKENKGKSFQGSKLDGIGFVLTPTQAKALINSNEKNSEVIFPYLNGGDVNSRPDQSPSRWVINFFDWPLNRSAEGSWSEANSGQRSEWLDDGCVPKDYPGRVASDYHECLNVVSEKVKPARASHGESRARLYWWRFQRTRPEMYKAIAGLPRVLVAVQTSKYLSLSMQPPDIVFSHMLIVFATGEFADFGALNASWHTEWIIERCSKLETRLRYIPTDGFETFPLPGFNQALAAAGYNFYETRSRLMLGRGEGLTSIYNKFHDQDENAIDIANLREQQVLVDRAAAAAYSWDDIQLEHDFHRTYQGVRFTVSRKIREEIINRLISLNHRRHDEEVAAGLAGKVTNKPNPALLAASAAVSRNRPVQPGLDFTR